MKKIACLICLYTCLVSAFATQKETASALQQLQQPAPDSVKIAVNEQVKTALLAYLQANHAFTARIDSMPFIGSVYDADSTLRIISWNYGMENGNYGCNAVLVKNKRKKEPLIHVLSTSNVTLPTEQKRYTAKNWYGALYYRIIKQKDKYLLLGYTMYQPATRVKLIDVLEYEKDKPYFGEKLFDWNGKIKRRVVFEYGSMVQMLLHYDEMQKGFVFDHLSPEEPSMEGIKAYYGPDFSYDGLFYRKQKWTLQEDLNIKNGE